MSSAAEAELGALFHNTKEDESIRTILCNLGHPQPPIPLQTDNKLAAGNSSDSMKQKEVKLLIFNTIGVMITSFKDTSTSIGNLVQKFMVAILPNIYSHS